MDNHYILLLAGTPKEIIDGVRYYANCACPEHHGFEVAKRLEAQGAKVTLVTPGPSVISACDLMKAASHHASQPITAVANLATISSFCPAYASAQKLKIKEQAGYAVPMEVIGNVNAWERLKALFPGIPVIGYRDNKLMANTRNPLTESLMKLIVETQSHSNPIPASAHTIEPISDELAGRRVIITSGPTVEKLTLQGDAITNFSSGRQGYAIVEALAAMGAQVTLITGPSALPDLVHPNIETMHVTTAHEMHGKVMTSLPADVYIGVAAVGDFGIEKPIDLQLQEGELYTLQLMQNPDILQSVGLHKTLRPKIVIGFAAETDQRDMLEYARGKLESKGADAICANHAGAAGSSKNRITWVSRDSTEPWAVMDKRAIGRVIGVKLASMLISGL